MRYLAILLLAPWLLILCWAYWAYPKSMVRSAMRRLFDLSALLLALAAAVTCALRGFDTAPLPAVDQFGRGSGGIWQQVLPALYGYGAFAAVLLIAVILRQLCWRRR
jgi:hypothetical protein